ncbi:MAG TPA: bifunctional DNA primase/polymerase, partial [bacterium]
MAAHQKARPPSEGGAGRKAASGQARREDITSAAIGREPAPNPCHAAAIEHIEAGRPVMPVNPTSKRPLLASWRHLQDRLPTAEELEDWFTTWPG